MCARTFLLELPELGTLTRQQIAALVGVAPLNCDSGTRPAHDLGRGGRARGRTVLYMGTLVATRHTPRIKAFTNGFSPQGRSKVALTACMRKLLTMLNAMLKHRTPWQAQEVQRKNIQGPLDNQDSCSAPTSLRLSVAPEARRSAASAPLCNGWS